MIKQKTQNYKILKLELVLIFSWQLNIAFLKKYMPLLFYLVIFLKPEMPPALNNIIEKRAKTLK